MFSIIRTDGATERVIADGFATYADAERALATAHVAPDGTRDVEDAHFFIAGFGPVLLSPTPETFDPGTVRLGDGFITAEFPPRGAS